MKKMFVPSVSFILCSCFFFCSSSLLFFPCFGHVLNIFEQLFFVAHIKSICIYLFYAHMHFGIWIHKNFRRSTFVVNFGSCNWQTIAATYLIRFNFIDGSWNAIETVFITHWKTISWKNTHTQFHSALKTICKLCCIKHSKTE